MSKSKILFIAAIVVVLGADVFLFAGAEWYHRSMGTAHHLRF